MELEHVTDRLLRAACGGDLAAASDIVERHPATTRVIDAGAIRYVRQAADGSVYVIAGPAIWRLTPQ
jgi:hypothetical protein